MTKKYYSLRFGRDDAFNKAGKTLCNADNPLRIGQTESCDIRLANDSQYEDTDLCIIERRTDSEGWKLVGLSPFKEHEVRVNGTPINYVHLLADGDRIAFEGQRQELTFNVREDDQYTSNGIQVVHYDKTSRIGIGMASLTLLLLLGIFAFMLNDRPVSDRMLNQAKRSVYKIRVDSVQLQVSGPDGTHVKAKAPVEGIFGTAFLTTDGQLVTARHCIEPWLNIDEKKIVMDTLKAADTLRPKDDSKTEAPAYVKLALEAVTLNIIAEALDNGTRWDLVSICKLTKPDMTGDSVLLRVASTDFIMDKSRDEIVEYGDFIHQYFWRSISVRPRRIDMMLGDVACLPDANSLLHGKGTIRMASRNEMRKLCQKNNLSVNIMGRTTTDKGNKKIESPTAEMSYTLDESDFTEDGYLQGVLSHKGSIKPGFSGGPIIARYGIFGWRAIGVVSVKDKYDNDDRFYSVPITEVERMNNKPKTTTK